MVDIADIAMLFVRCRGGISHIPTNMSTQPMLPPAPACCCA
jgi:hypothetical protein